MSFHIDPRHHQAYLNTLEASVRPVRLVAPKRRAGPTPMPAALPQAAPKARRVPVWRPAILGLAAIGLARRAAE